MTEFHPCGDFKPSIEHPLSPLFVINRLRAELVDMRKAAGLTQEKVAKDALWSTSKVIRFETAQTAADRADIRELLNMYGIVDEEKRASIEAQVEAERMVRKRDNAAWSLYTNLTPTTSLTYWEHEGGAKRIRTFRPTFLPDVMQPDGYVKAVECTPHRSLTPEQIQAAATLRQQRATYLLGKHGPEMHIILDQSVLERAIGGYDTMAVAIDGLKYLNTAGRRSDGAIPDHLNPNISIQVVPYDAARYISVHENYSIFDTAQPGGVSAYADRPSGRVDRPSDAYLNYFQTLADNVPDPGETNALLTSIQEANAKR